MSETSSIVEEWDWSGLNLTCFDFRLKLKMVECFVDHDYSRALDQERTDGRLTFSELSITHRMIDLLRPLLSNEVLHESIDNMETISGSTANDTPTVFSSIDISSCGFYSRDDATTLNQDDVCTPDDQRCFLSAMTRCSDMLIIKCSPEILSDWLNTPDLHCKAKFLEIVLPDRELSELEYISLGFIIQRNVKLKRLLLGLQFMEVPQEFCDNLANAVHVESLWLRSLAETRTPSHTQVDTFFTKMISNEAGSGVLECLLRNPHQRLKKLDLSWSSLQDHHVMVLAHLLPDFHLEEIHLDNNYIQPPGFLEFARQIPRMHSLRAIALERNPWEQSSLVAREECGAAMLHGLIEIPTIEDMGDTYFLSHYPQCLLLWHYLVLNNAGRRLLTSSPGQSIPVPDGLWPIVFHRAGLRSNWKDRVPFDDDTVEVKYNSEASVIYYFLQNCPRLWSRRNTCTGARGC